MINTSTQSGVAITARTQGSPGGTSITIWLNDPPAALPSPGQLAQEALERMDLQPIQIGIVPEPSPDKLGLVGMPVWMWVDNPTGNTFGPITESATAGSVTVTATARVDSIDWDMGDGSVPVHCTSPGTAYEDSYGKQDSPDCGHRYTKTSADQPNNAYTVTATANWVVNWTGGGQSGTIELSHVSSTRIQVGEAQVLAQ